VLPLQPDPRNYTITRNGNGVQIDTRSSIKTYHNRHLPCHRAKFTLDAKFFGMYNVICIMQTQEGTQRMNTVEIRDISAASIRITGLNDRKKFDKTKLELLAASIRENGLLNPITICPDGDGFKLVAGERRFRAMTEVLGWDLIPCIIRELTDEEFSQAMLAENTGRLDLDVIEEANAYQSRLDNGWSKTKIAEVAGVSVERINKRIKLLNLTCDIQHMIAAGSFPLGHAEALADIDRNRQLLVIKLWNQKPGISLTYFREIVKQYRAAQEQEALFDLDNFWVEQVKKDDLPRKGKRAVTGAPTRRDIPPVRGLGGRLETVGSVLDRYIADLLKAGFSGEAAVIGNLYDALAHTNLVSVPEDAELLKIQSQPDEKGESDNA